MQCNTTLFLILGSGGKNHAIFTDVQNTEEVLRRGNQAFTILFPSPKLRKLPNLFEPGSGVQPKAVQDQSICKYKKQSPATFCCQ